MVLRVYNCSAKNILKIFTFVFISVIKLLLPKEEELVEFFYHYKMFLGLAIRFLLTIMGFYFPRFSRAKTNLENLEKTVFFVTLKENLENSGNFKEIFTLLSCNNVF